MGIGYTFAVRGSRPWIAIGALAAGVVAGYVLGGVAPRSELARREAEIEDLEARLDDAAGPGAWRSPVPGLDRILRVPEDDPAFEDARIGTDDGDTEDGRAGGAELADGADAGAERPRWRDRWRARSEQRVTMFRRAADVQRVRRVQSRAALQQQAGLDDEEMAEVDAALDTMNEELLGYGEELLVLAMRDEPPAARDLLGITHDVTGILHRAQMELERVVGPERAAEVDPSALEIWNHVDLGQLEPAARAAAQRR